MWIDGLVVWDGLVKKERWWGSVENKGTILNKNVIYSKFYYRKNKQKSHKFFEKIYIYLSTRTLKLFMTCLYTLMTISLTKFKLLLILQAIYP